MIFQSNGCSRHRAMNEIRSLHFFSYPLYCGTSGVIPDGCPPPPLHRNADLVSYNISVQETAVFTCHLGYRFWDGDKTKAVRCLVDRTWEDLPRCLCKYCWCKMIGSTQTNLPRFIQKRIIWSSILSVHQWFQ